nr:retrovirus-related Pol polyprotein from transposon TNT 1-94 [Tanacetum cinerariifolium]
MAEFPQIDSGLAVHLRNSSNPRQQATIHDGRVIVQPLQGRQNSYADGTSGTRANTLGTRGNYSSQQRVVKCFNCQGEGHMARQCPKPKRTRDVTWFKDKVVLVEAQGKGKVLNEEELEFLADPAKTVLMANLSSYGSDVLSNVPYSDNTHNDMLNQSIRPMLYDGSVIAKETNVISIADSEETLMLEEENFGKRFVPQQELSDKQAFRLQKSHPNTNQSASSPVKIEAPRELPKVSLNTSLKKLKYHLGQFDSVVKKRITPDALTEEEWAFEHTKADFLNEIIPFVKTLKDIFNVFDKDLLNEVTEGDKLIDENEHLKQTYKQLYDSIKPSPVRAKEQTESLVNQVNQKIIEKLTYTILSTLEQADILREIVEQARSLNPLDSVSYSACNIHRVTNRPLLSYTGVNPSTSASGSKPSSNTKNDRIPQTPSSNEKNKVEVQSRKVKSSLNKRNSDSKNVCNEYVKHYDKGAKAICSICNDCLFDANHAMCLINHVNSMNTFTLVGNASPLTRLTTTSKVPLRVPIPLEVVAPSQIVTRVYTKRPKVPKSAQHSKPKVAKSMTANRMEPDTSRGSNTSVGPSSSSLINCRMEPDTSRGSNTSVGPSSSSLINCSTNTVRRLSHLNFGAINYLARHGLVRGLPRLKFEKDHLCSACAIGKSKKQSHKSKSEDTNQEKLYLLHMDLCGPMRVACVNGKKYILVIVDDYSRFTWVKFLASKDEAPDFIIKFMKMIQVRLNAAVRNIRTDNGTEFVNQNSRDYYEQVGISHEVARTDNGVVERRNCTLVEVAQTIENLGKLHAKADIGIFIGYAPKKKAYRTYNRRTRKIIETIHVDFDELTAMAFEQLGSGPGLHEMTPATPSSGLAPNPHPSTPFVPPSRH